jgi:hypothetical protein
VKYEELQRAYPKRVIDKFYFCRVCGEENNPFLYRDKEFERIKSDNVCPKCWKGLDKKELYEKDRKVS